MLWSSGAVFQRLFRNGVGREAPGEPSKTSWNWPDFEKAYERARAGLKRTTGEEARPYPADGDTTRRWIAGETRIQRGYRAAVFAVFYGVDRRPDDSDTGLQLAWTEDDRLALMRRTLSPAGRIGHKIEPPPDEHRRRASWQGGSPPLPVDAMPAPRELMADVVEKVRHGNQAACVLWGKPGIGKSTLAALLAPAIADDPDARLYWLKFRPDGFHEVGDATPHVVFYRLAKMLSGNVTPDTPLPTLREEIGKALSGKPHLLVYDNIRDEAELRAHQINAVHGILLATSLYPRWEYFENVEVDLWPPSVCRDYIRRRIPKKIPVADPDVLLNKLAETVGYLPLGLAQSTAYIRRAGSCSATIRMGRQRQSG